jgi:hypothetical protein
MQVALARNQAAARGTVLSGGTVMETARIEGARVTALLQSRLGLLLEGFTLHKARLDDQLVEDIVKEIGRIRSDFIAEANETYSREPFNQSQLFSHSVYSEMLEREIGLTENEVRTQIDRKRLIPDGTEQAVRRDDSVSRGARKREMKIFWSWQSDTPGKTGRFLVRSALQGAIDKLKQTPDLEEAVRGPLHLDQDIQDITGSPDLVRTIFEKIEQSEVVVADVTVVGATIENKKLIN